MREEKRWRGEKTESMIKKVKEDQKKEWKKKGKMKGKKEGSEE